MGWSIYFNVNKLCSSVRNCHMAWSGISAEFLDGLHIVSKNQGLSSLLLYAMTITSVIMPAAFMFTLLTTGHYGGGKWEMGLAFFLSGAFRMNGLLDLFW